MHWVGGFSSAMKRCRCASRGGLARRRRSARRSVTGTTGIGAFVHCVVGLSVAIRRCRGASRWGLATCRRIARRNVTGTTDTGAFVHCVVGLSVAQVTPEGLNPEIATMPVAMSELYPAGILSL